MYLSFHAQDEHVPRHEERIRVLRLDVGVNGLYAPTTSRAQQRHAFLPLSCARTPSITC